MVETKKCHSKRRYKDAKTLDHYKATISALTPVIIISAFGGLGN